MDRTASSSTAPARIDTPARRASSGDVAALSECQRTFVVALERAAAWPDIDTLGLALHHVIGGIMVEHADHPRIRAALGTIKARGAA